MKKSMLLATAGLLALGTGAMAQPVPDNLKIVPGQHLGQVFIGDSKAAVHRRLGAPNRTFTLPGGLTSELWRGKPFGDGSYYTLEVVYRRNAATQIEATNPVFRTARGLSTDSHVGDWEDAIGDSTTFGKYHYGKGKPDQGYYDWVGKGVALETQYGGDSFSIHTVIVHRRNSRVIMDGGAKRVL